METGLAMIWIGVIVILFAFLRRHNEAQQTVHVTAEPGPMPDYEFLARNIAIAQGYPESDWRKFEAQAFAHTFWKGR